ncbi:hypothetical protein BHE74_00058857 [Ensete ventricosum]|nr:hypothetical protein BHE74_00058857 [Ensete ventricosum]
MQYVTRAITLGLQGTCNQQKLPTGKGDVGDGHIPVGRLLEKAAPTGTALASKCNNCLLHGRPPLHQQRWHLCKRCMRESSEPSSRCCLRVTPEWVGKGELPKGANTIRGGGGPMMCWQRPHIEKLGMIRALGELDCSSAYSLKGTRQVRGQGRDFCVIIDPLLLWRESIGHKRGRVGGECKGKLQVPRQDGRAKAKELHMTGVDGLLIKIVESEGLWVDAEVLDQERSMQYVLLYLFYSEE